MNEMKKFRLLETIKDRYTSMAKASPTLEYDADSIEKMAPILTDVIGHFEDIRKKQDDSGGITYLMDCVGFYMLLFEESQKLNNQLLSQMEEWVKNDN